MKKALAIFLSVWFVVMIIGGTAQASREPMHGDIAFALGQLIGFLLAVTGLYYSTKWRISLSGHTYRLGRQTWTALLFSYSVFAAFIGLTLLVVERNTIGLSFGGVMLVIWLSVGYVCWRWRRSLRSQEQAQCSQTATP
jgi:hypothetical protein